MKKLMPFLLVMGVTVSAPLAVRASDSYPSSATKAMDSTKYTLGQKLYTGQVKLGATDAKLTAKQSIRLKELQNQLPKAVQKTAKLPEMAGKLNASQLNALEYYLQMRYQVK